MVWVLDASVFIALATNESSSDELIRELKNKKAIYPTTVLTESYPVILRKGVRKFEDKTKGERILKENFELLKASFKSLEVSEEIAVLAGKLSLKYWKQNISYMDCIIAAASIVKQGKVLTLDSDFSDMNEVDAKVIRPI